MLSIIIPAYNEQVSVKGTVDNIQRVLGQAGLEFEIIVVNDASTDDTEGELNKCSGIRHITNFANLGYGGSIKKGFQIAKYDLVCITDADGTYPVEEIPRLVDLSRDVDMIVGARLGDIRNIPFARRPAKWFLNRFASLVSGHPVPDLNSGLRIFRKRLFSEFLHLLPSGFSLTSTLTIAALTNGYNVRFEPINYYKRTGKSSIQPVRDTLRFVNLIVGLAVLFSPLKIFTPVAIVLFLLGSIKACFTLITQQRIGAGESMIIVLAGLLFLMGHLANAVVLMSKRTNVK